jgi:hypothetical protein
VNLTVPGGKTHTHGTQTRSANQGLPDLRPPLLLAATVGGMLGCREVLL